MKDPAANPHVAKLVRAWRRHSRGARLLMEHFDGDDTGLIDYLNSHCTVHDMARDLAHEPPAERRALVVDLLLSTAKPRGDC